MIHLQRIREKIYLGTKQLRLLLLFSEEETEKVRGKKGRMAGGPSVIQMPCSTLCKLTHLLALNEEDYSF